MMHRSVVPAPMSIFRGIRKLPPAQRKLGIMWGTAGAVLAGFELLADRFLVLYGDTMVNVDLTRLWQAHEQVGEQVEVDRADRHRGVAGGDDAEQEETGQRQQDQSHKQRREQHLRAG